MAVWIWSYFSHFFFSHPLSSPALNSWSWLGLRFPQTKLKLSTKSFLPFWLIPNSHSRTVPEPYRDSASTSADLGTTFTVYSDYHCKIAFYQYVSPPHARTRPSYTKLSASRHCWKNSGFWPTQISAARRDPNSCADSGIPGAFNRLRREIPAYAKPVPLRRRPGLIYHDSWASVPNTGPRNPWITNRIGWWTYYRVFGYRRLHALPIPNPVDRHTPRHDWPSGCAFRPSSTSRTTHTRRTQYFTLPPVSGGNFL